MFQTDPDRLETEVTRPDGSRFLLQVLLRDKPKGALEDGTLSLNVGGQHLTISKSGRGTLIEYHDTEFKSECSWAQATSSFESLLKGSDKSSKKMVYKTKPSHTMKKG